MTNKTIANATLITVFTSVLMLSGCSEQTTYQEQPVPKVDVYTVTHDDDRQTRVFSAVTKAHNLVPLSFKVQGQLEKLPIKAGSRIEKGQLLAQLEQGDFERNVTEAKASLVLAEKNYQRAKTLLPQEAISQSEHDTLKAQFEVASAVYKQTKQALSYTQIKAPFSGVVSEVIAENFESVKPGQTLFSIHSTEHILVEVQVSEKLIAGSNKSNLNRPFPVKIEQFPNANFQARYYEHQTEMDPQTKSYLFSLIMPRDNNRSILPGMSVSLDVDIKLLGSKDIPVPNEALRYSNLDDLDAKKTYVWVYQTATETVRKQEVTTGALTQKGIIVTQGISPGDQVVISGSHALSENQKVQLLSNNQLGETN